MIFIDCDSHPPSLTSLTSLISTHSSLPSSLTQVTDHCIEWSRDQFELLFAKLGKKLELAVRDFGAFEAEQVSVVVVAVL